MTVEQQGTHLDITTTSVATSEEAAATATDAAQGNDLLKVVADTPVHAADVSSSVATAGTSTDPSRPSQWALDQAGFESAWSRTDGSCLVVGVVDTGVQSDHPDLAGQVLGGERFTTNSNTGVTMDPAFDDAGHGTHVAGIIAAVANNGTGITGAAPGVKILPVKVLDSSGSGFDSDVARGINWAVLHGAKVINLSLGGCTPGASDTAVANAVANGVMVFAAAGNNGNSSSGGCGVNAPVLSGRLGGCDRGRVGQLEPRAQLVFDRRELRRHRGTRQRDPVHLPDLDVRHAVGHLDGDAVRGGDGRADPGAAPVVDRGPGDAAAREHRDRPRDPGSRLVVRLGLHQPERRRQLTRNTRFGDPHPSNLTGHSLQNGISRSGGSAGGRGRRAGGGCRARRSSSWSSPTRGSGTSPPPARARRRADRRPPGSSRSSRPGAR